MKLIELNAKLEKTDEELAVALAKVFPLEVEYTTRYNQLMLHSGMANQTGREAEALETLKQEDIYVKYHEAKLTVKILYSRKDTLIEISRNIRSLAFAEV